VPLFRHAVEVLRTCEELRHAGRFDETVRAQLREPGREFALFTDRDGQPRFRRSQAVPQVVTGGEPWTSSWQVSNPFAGQPVRLRIGALMSVGASDGSNATVLAGTSLLSPPNGPAPPRPA
jgi:hypothetical protein